MTKKRQILNTIAEIRQSHPDMQRIFMQGSCMNFHMILRSIYPEAEPYFNINHVVTKIDDTFYDITGIVNPKDYTPFHTFYNKRRTSRAYTQMYNYNGN